MSDRVRPMMEDDVETVLAWRNHPEIRQSMYSQDEIPLAECRAWFARCAENPLQSLLVFEADGVSSGFVNLKEEPYGRIGTWGFYAAPGCAPGTGSRLGGTALAYAFGPAGLYKVCGEAIAYNKASIRFHEKMGFRQEGVLRDHYFDGNTYHDVFRFGLISTEWTDPSPHDAGKSEDE